MSLALVTFSLCSMVGLTLLRGLVLQALWSWFIVTTFGLPSLTLAEAIGVSLVVTFMTYQAQHDDPDNDKRSPTEKTLATVFTSLFLYGFAFIFGAIVHACM